MGEDVVIWSLIILTASAIGATIICYVVWPALGWATDLAVRAACALAALAALILPTRRPGTTPRPRRSPVRP